MVESDLGRSFGSDAAAYDSVRPTYPAATVAWMLAPVDESVRVRVADVGAGTGKLTRSLIADDREVAAVDPDIDMLAVLRAHLPEVPVMQGTAESLPFDDGALDAVVVGQAWHWADVVQGSREIGRVLRPGGVVGLAWNWIVEPVTSDRSGRLATLMPGGSISRAHRSRAPALGRPFGRLESQTTRWYRCLTRSDVVALARSRSVYLGADAARRVELDNALSETCDDLGLHGSTTVALLHETRAWRAVRP